jgi:Flp pilus assembly protein TadD
MAADASRTARAGRGQKAPATTDGLEIAMGHMRGSPEATAVLERQVRLIDAQEALARADLRHRGWQIIGERVGATLKGLTALAAFILLFAVGGFVWSSASTDGVVVEPFAVPADLERRGFSGAVVAAQLLDRINAIEASTESARAASSYASSWSEDTEVEVPYAGVSFGQLRRELSKWLGSQTRLSGEVLRLDGGRVAISLRTGRETALRVEGNEAELDDLLQRAALAAFRATQPYRYSVWLIRNNPDAPEQRAILTMLSRSPDLNERLWGLHGLALIAPTDEEAVAIYERALRLRPDFLPAIGNMPFYAARAGREEEGYRLARRAAFAYASGQSDYNPSHAAGYGKDAEAEVASYEGDLLRAAQLYSSAIEDAGGASNVALRPFRAAGAWAAVHDWAAARATLRDAGYLDAAIRADVEARYGYQSSPRLLFAAAVGDAAVEAVELQAALSRATALSSRLNAGLRATREPPVLNELRIRLALALARARRTAEADAVARQLPREHDEAIRVRGLIAAYAGRDAESDSHLARAVARTPSLPAGHAAWAEALLARGDAAGAAQQAELAHRKGPRWAEPLVLWATALSRQGNLAEAERRYREAAERAPRWGAVRLAWADALWRLGRQEEARAQLRAVTHMNVSPKHFAWFQRQSARAGRVG